MGRKSCRAWFSTASVSGNRLRSIGPLRPATPAGAVMSWMKQPRLGVDSLLALATSWGVREPCSQSRMACSDWPVTLPGAG